MKFTLLTPSRQVMDTMATAVNLPGEAGHFGVLPGHMSLVSLLQDGGQVEVTAEDGTRHTYTVSGAFVDVRPDAVTILAESVD